MATPRSMRHPRLSGVRRVELFDNEVSEGCRCWPSPRPESCGNGVVVDVGRRRGSANRRRGVFLKITPWCGKPRVSLLLMPSSYGSIQWRVRSA